MARAPYQVSVLPYRQTIHAGWEFAIFLRSVEGYWQWIAGAGEDDETPLEAAQREAFEEGRIPASGIYLPLATSTCVPVYHFKAARDWPKDLYVIPVHYFAVEAADDEIRLSREHSSFRWVDDEQGQTLLKWDSDRTALWELHERLKTGQDLQR